MKNFFKQKGQITVPLVYAVVGLIGTVIAPVLWVNGIEANNQDQHAVISERVVKIETLTPVMQSDIQEIKDDIKDIKRALNIK